MRDFLANHHTFMRDFLTNHHTFMRDFWGQPLHFYEGLSTKTRVSHIESTYKKCLREE